MSITGEELSYNETRVLLTLNETGPCAPEDVLKAGKFEQLVEVMNAASWLQMKGLVSIGEEDRTFYQLANSCDLSRKLVSQDAPGPFRDPAVSRPQDPQIRPTDSSCPDLDQGFVRLDVRNRDFYYFDIWRAVIGSGQHCLVHG